MTISVIVPAINEEAVIGDTLGRAVSALAPHELLVADGCSTDRTAEIARAYATVLPLAMTRGAALNHAAALATGDVLLFLHADTQLPVPPPRPSRLLCGIRRSSVGLFGCAWTPQGGWPNWFGYSVNVRSSLVNTLFGDQAMFVRREVFAKRGGFENWSVMEDLEILARLRQYGRLTLLDAEVVTSARRHQKHGWLRTISTIWMMTLLVRLGVPGYRMAGLYGPAR